MLEAGATAATAQRFFLLAVYGLRCSEVRQLRLDDIDWDREIVTVRRAKCRKTQDFPLTREVGDAIVQYIREIRPKCEHREIFITLPSSRHSRKKVTPHVIPHTTTCHLLKAGVDLNTIRAWLGHVSLDTTNVYAEIDVENEVEGVGEMRDQRDGNRKRWRDHADLMVFLKSL